MEHSHAMRRDLRAIFTAVMTLLVVLWPLAARAQTASAPAADKIELTVLYAGHVGSQREADFVGFLKEHFRDVKTMDLAGFTGRESGFDVAILDYDGDYFAASAVKPPRIALPADYSRPTVTVGVLGAMLCGSHGLKTGYL